MSSYISNDELLDRIQKLEDELGKLKEENKLLKETIKETSTCVAREEVKYQTYIIKNEVRDELRKELSTKEDIILMKEELMRYIDNKSNQLDGKYNQLDKKMTVGFIVLFMAVIILNPTTLELVRLIFK
jgi:predicted RNase H-like nuclease (RuvC/YqgF family)